MPRSTERDKDRRPPPSLPCALTLVRLLVSGESNLSHEQPSSGAGAVFLIHSVDERHLLRRGLLAGADFGYRGGRGSGDAGTANRSSAAQTRSAQCRRPAA